MKTRSTVPILGLFLGVSALVATTGCASSSLRHATGTATTVSATPENFVQPKPLSQPAPAFPSGGRRDGIADVVNIKFLVDETGVVRQPQVESSTDSMLEGPALAAVEKWVFSPARRDGAPVAAWIRVPITFRATSP